MSRARKIKVADDAVTRKSEVSRIQILAAAARLFRDQGYVATTLRQIAAAADMEAGSIYYYFASKNELLDEVLDEGVRRVSKAVEEARTRHRGPSHHAPQGERVRVGQHPHLRSAAGGGETSTP
jgi:AcrR family transcriptional regulator